MGRKVVMKWSVVFLLLVNALVLFGFSMRQSRSVGDDEVLPSLQTIRLVNESDQILVIKLIFFLERTMLTR